MEKVKDKVRVDGSGNQAKGAVKQAAGTIAGDAKLKVEGPSIKRRARPKVLSVAPATPRANPKRLFSLGQIGWQSPAGLVRLNRQEGQQGMDVHVDVQSHPLRQDAEIAS